MTMTARTDAGSWANQGVVPREGQGTGWVVVADEAIARILTTNDTPGLLDPLEALTDPAAHTKEGELGVHDAGRRGMAMPNERSRNGDRAGGAGLTTSAGEGNQHLEARDFAKRVAAHLATALQQKRYTTLRIAAAPRFLGLLRQELHANVKAVVVDEMDKELTHASDDDVAKRFFKQAA
jgi:protein required for attachment to host cells